MESHFHIQCSCMTTANQRGLNKPNEDYYLTDEANRIYMVLDGVTRNHDEYAQMQQESPARTVSRLFASSVQRTLVGAEMRQKTPDAIKRLLRDAIERANRDVAAYCAGKQWSFLPATVCVLCIVIEHTVYYAYIGDCIGMLLRDGQKIRFTQEQTSLRVWGDQRRTRSHGFSADFAYPAGTRRHASALFRRAFRAYGVCAAGGAAKRTARKPAGGFQAVRRAPLPPVYRR